MKGPVGLLARLDPVQCAELDEIERTIDTIAERFECSRDMAWWWWDKADQPAIDAVLSHSSNVVPLMPVRH
jgi:hypothetical protein